MDVAWRQGLLSATNPTDISMSIPGTAWANTEFRSYTFDTLSNSEEDANARITETHESRLRRGKTGARLGPEVQGELFNAATQRWEHLGMQSLDKVGSKTAKKSDDVQGEEQPAVGVELEKVQSPVEVAA